MSPLSLKPKEHDEFAAGASEWPNDVSRRDFLQVMAASFALGGLTACGRGTPKLIVPRVSSPEAMDAPGEVRFYTTVMPFEGYGRGIVVRTNSSRPTKIEGNPDHPESLGATDVFTQAAILSLYDPDRSPAPLRAGEPATWKAFETEWLVRREKIHAQRGQGFALLTEPTTSPTLLREIHRVMNAWPEARWFQHTPLGRYDRDGQQIDFDFARADVILSIQSDCFYRHPSSVRYGRALAQRRRSENGKVNATRFYAMEPIPSVTGALADFRLPVSPARLRVVLDHLAAAIAGTNGDDGTLSTGENAFVRALADDIRAHPGRVACIAGPECDADIQAWTDALNARAGHEVTKQLTSVRSDRDPRSSGDLASLSNALSSGNVTSLFILGANPTYSAPIDLSFIEKMRRVEFTVHLGEHVDETAGASLWHLPESHFLETWSDLRGFDGTASIQQPMVEPLHDSRSAAEILRLISGSPDAKAYDLVRETWRGTDDTVSFETRWHQSLVRGVIEPGAVAEVADPGETSASTGHPEPASTRPATTSPDAATFPILARSVSSGSLIAIIQPDPNILDGRWSNNAWLQELPKPLTHLVWENAGLISPQLARELSLDNGDVVACEINHVSAEIPVWIMPGQAPGTVALSLGYGRAHAGTIGTGIGYDAYRLRLSTALWQREGVTLRKLGRKHPLVCTQGHFTMEGREPARVIAPASTSQQIEDSAPPPSLYPDWRKDTYAWGMSIDLSTCLGCNACIIACQAENNIPVVGRDQVARGREMHWIRVDRYYSGDVTNPRFVAQPVPCMHCENAPCEVVCPVGATVHSSEGLNDMIYNRCVGTRYCSNNCPYKVRRFNFLDYRSPRDSTVYFQANPNVTVRERGVMEKCTYCVQRINAARIDAEKQNRRIRDGEIKTACQQACPAEAIVFGDLNDPTTRVVRRKAEPTNYSLLAELNTRPRTTYLAAIRQTPLPS